MSVLFVSVVAGIAVFASLNSLLELKFISGVRQFFNNLFISLWGHLEQYNRKRRSERIKRENIAFRKEDIIVKYNRLIDEFLKSFNLNVPLETATSLIAILFAIIVVILTLFLQEVTVALLIAVSIMIALFTWFTYATRVRRSARADAISDAEDAICPLARDGVLIAIKSVLETDEYIHKSIRLYFQEFVDNCETRGYSFRQAMMHLNRQLGSRFDNFAEKAIVFEYNERKGMADIFLDIVDENAVTREINAKKEDLFKKMNRDFLMKSLLIVLFFVFSLSVKGFRDFMMFSTAGKFINSLCLNAICIAFAWGQSLQGSLELRRQGRKSRKEIL